MTRPGRSRAIAEPIVAGAVMSAAFRSSASTSKDAGQGARLELTLELACHFDHVRDHARFHAGGLAQGQAPGELDLAPEAAQHLRVLAAQRALDVGLCVDDGDGARIHAGLANERPFYPDVQ